MQGFENYHGEDGVPVPTERSFGITFLFVFLILGLWPLLWGRPLRDIHAVLLGIAGLNGLFGLAFPKALYYPNLLWFKFGMVLHKIMNPLIMGILFFLVITPYGFLMKLVGKKFMPMGPDKRVATYWIERRPPGPEPETMKHQF